MFSFVLILNETGFRGNLLCSIIRIEYTNSLNRSQTDFNKYFD